MLARGEPETRELAHVVGDSAPALVLAEPGVTLPSGLDAVARLDVSLTGAAAELPAEPDDEAPALIVHTSGTTRRPAAPRDRVHSGCGGECLAVDGERRVVHALPLFHVHGLILGVLGPLRLGGADRIAE